MERFPPPQKGLALGAEDIADALWLALHMGEVVVPESPPTEGDQRGSDQIRPADQIRPGDQRLPRGLPPLPPSSTPQSEIYPTGTDSEVGGGVPIQVPDAAALRHPLLLMRSLRPLMRKVPSRLHSLLDEDATVNQIADDKVWLPVMRPAPERWLELALVIEETTALPIWQRTIQEFQQLVGRHGAFRDVRTWRLVPDRKSGGELQLFPGEGRASGSGRARSPKELLDATQRRLIVLISDCVSPAWQSGQMVEWLRPFANLGMVSVMQLLPERYWERTALGRGYPVEISALAPGLPNAKLTVQGLPDWAVAPSMPLETPEETIPPLPNQSPPPVLMTLPVVTLDPQLMQDWAQMLAANGGNQTAGRVLDPAILAQHNGVEPELLEGEQRFQRFWSTASPPARQLAGYLATVPISMPVVRLVQRVLLPESSPMHVAEVFFSGILRPASAQEARADYVQYEFVAPEIRDRLRRTARLSDGQEVIEQVSGYIAEKLGLATRDFQAVLRAAVAGNASQHQYLEPFARIASPFLQRLGGDYAALANIADPLTRVNRPQRVADATPVEQSTQKRPTQASNHSIIFPPLKTLEFAIIQLVDEVDNPGRPPLRLQTEQFTVATLALEPETNSLDSFEFTVATLKREQTGLLRRRTEWVIQRQQQQAWRLLEALTNDLILELVAIPGGKFLMGSPKNEPERYDESPQHPVTVADFFMGRYPVTQSQWRFVAGLPQVGCALDANPARFKGNNRPVEQVSWHDATEFCTRLSQHTGRSYRLPTEAEWEYACRAGTTTPFHFGEMMIPDLANYAWDETYNNSNVTKEKDFEGTTPIEQFGIANAFGLCEMHGNVWEWCEDHWHSNYGGAPVNSSAWLDPDASEDADRVLRGGAWNDAPRYCRSATRFNDAAGSRLNSFGFRVVCVGPRILP
jgi:formylglycine-generating enzyme required for sulfatase activity